ncbi:MAG: glycosyltransferase family 2 protein [Fibrobacter sp.]|nr:glycosyltransferase family 2 protein [Fibrobacter sp.]
MHSQPLVTIAIPAYKADFIREAISSALNQSYSNIELVIVDDCSPEKIDIVVKEFSDPRIHYYRNEKNVGSEDPSKNWNKCLEYAKGVYFALLCDDDTYEPTFVEEMLKLQQDFPDVKVFRARARTIDENNNVTNWYPSAPTFETCFDYMYQRLSGFRRQTISEFLYDTAYIKGVGGFTNTPRAWTADSLSVYKFAWSNGIASTQKFLVNFRCSKKSISSIYSDAIEKIEAIVLFKKEINKLISEISDNEKKKLLKEALYYSVFTDTIEVCSHSSFWQLIWTWFKGAYPRKWIFFIIPKRLGVFYQKT